MIYITGDTHADFRRFNTRNFPEQKQLTKDDYVIVCGDFGLWDGSKREIHDIDWLDGKPYTTLFVSGNHSNYDMLDAMPVAEWHGGEVNYIRPSVIHLRRGQIYDIGGKRIFTFGGASSHDIEDGILDRSDIDFREKKKRLDDNNRYQYRINHETWWAQELPTQAEMDAGLANLAAVGNKVDYIITHCAPDSLFAQLIDRKPVVDYLTTYLKKIHETVDYERWYCGHYHINRILDGGDNGDVIVVYDHILETDAIIEEVLE